MSDGVRTASRTGGEKGVKPERFDLIPVEPLLELALVYGRGAEKYAPNNWRRGYEWSKNFAAMQRHAWAFWNGEDFDPESKLHHLAHAAWHCFTLMWFVEFQQDFDDRPNTVEMAELWGWDGPLGCSDPECCGHERGEGTD